jgi:ABC-2 type transport system permease protein
MNANVLFAVFKRNFVSYFANPTGYVFICVFVLLSGFAAFWPNDFFNANLANLDQLTRWFPFIMLIFIPAITMSVWAQERAQGTDELLLTIPGSDLGIVAGKYLAAVAIFTVSLLFSLVCNFAVLAWLGEPDRGLFLGTYAGYWCIGLAMLAIGMVASFLTSNLTIAFILAALLNAPLVFAVFANAVLPADAALAVKQWSYGTQLRDFSQGVVSFSSIAYFATIVAVALYLSTVFLGRRHWSSGHMDVPRWAAYPLIVLVWLVVAALLYGVLLLGDEVLAILIANAQGEFLPEMPWPPLWRLICLGVAVAAAVGFIAVRQGWAWFPDRVSWMVFHYAGRTAALLIVAVCFNVLCRRQYHFYLDGLTWLDWAVAAAIALWAAGIAAVVAGGRNPWQFWVLFPALVILPFTGSATACALAVVAGAAAGIGWNRDRQLATKPAVAWLTLLVIVAAYALGLWAFDRFYLTEHLRQFGLDRATANALLGLLDIGVKLMCVAAGWRLLCQAFSVSSKTAAWAAPAAALAAGVFSLVVLVGSGSARIDVSSERLNSLSVPAQRLLDKMRFPHSVTIEAFVSPSVPESYVQTRMNLLAMLRQLETRFEGKVNLIVNNTERFSEEASRAKSVFGITPRKVPSTERGVSSDDEVFLGVAVKSGWRKVVVPFIGRGTPLEYELVRSLGTLAKEMPAEGEETVAASDGEQASQKAPVRKRLGIVPTAFSMQSNPLLDELRKQYDVVEVKWDEPITTAEYDVLLVVQPSSLVEGRPPMDMDPESAKKPPKPEHMDLLVAAIQSGVPTAVFQDPLPVAVPLPPPSPPMEERVFDMLRSMWKVPKERALRRETKLAEHLKPGQAAREEFREMLGQMFRTQITPEAFAKILTLGQLADAVDAAQKRQWGMRAMQAQMMGGQPPPPPPPNYLKLWRALGIELPHDQVVWQEYNPYPKEPAFSRNKEYVFLDDVSRAKFDPDDDTTCGLQHVLFAFPGWLAKNKRSPLPFRPLITTAENKTGTIKLDEIFTMGPEGPSINPQRTYTRKPRPYVLAAHIGGPGSPVDAIVVADADVLSPAFLHIREEAGGPESNIKFDLDNVTFVLNVIDSLAGDDRFIDIRNRRPKHRILTRVEQRTEKAKQETAEAREKFYEDCAENVKRETEEVRAKVRALEAKLKTGSAVEVQAAAVELGTAVGEFKTREDEKKKEYERIRDQKVAKSETELAQEIRRVQDQCKIWAVLLPPIPPLIVAAVVFFTRRVREREGVARSRLR